MCVVCVCLCVCVCTLVVHNIYSCMCVMCVCLCTLVVHSICTCKLVSVCLVSVCMSVCCLKDIERDYLLHIYDTVYHICCRFSQF